MDKIMNRETNLIRISGATRTEFIQQAVSRTVKAILGNAGQLQYPVIKNVLMGTAKYTKNDYIIFYLEMSAICRHIPRWENNTPVARPYNECFRDAITFYNAYQDETEIAEKSQNGFGQNLCENDFVLPQLTFCESNSHSIFTHGAGSGLPDLRDSDGLTYEVKYDYFNSGSPSSLHNADYLINCIKHDIFVHEVKNNRAKSNYIAEYANILSGRIRTFKPQGSLDTMQLIHSGELIAEIDAQLAKAGFAWNW